MADIGFLKPDGTLIPCNSWEHLNKAIEITESLGKAFHFGTDAEEFLQKQGWLVIRRNDVYGLIGLYNSETGKRYHLTDEQKNWLLVHYEDMSLLKRESVDDIFNNDRL